MIKSSEIRDGLSALIKEKARLNVEVHFNRVNNSGKDYIHVMLRPARRDEGYGVFGRRLSVIMQVVLLPNEYGEVSHTALYDIADKLDAATGGCVQIADRHITVYETDARIFDDILTYSFMLDFTDCADYDAAAEYELMKTLNVLVNENDNWSVKDGEE